MSAGLSKWSANIAKWSARKSVGLTSPPRDWKWHFLGVPRRTYPTLTQGSHVYNMD